MNDEENKLLQDLADKIVKDLVDESVEEIFIEIEPLLIKLLNKGEFKSFISIFIKFFIYLLGFSVMIFVASEYFLPNMSIPTESSAHLVSSIDIMSLLKNYIVIGLGSILGFYVLIIINIKFSSKSYIKQTEDLHNMRNMVLILFITQFCLQSFTLEQLDLISVIISTVVLFEVILKNKTSISEESIKSIVRRTYVELLGNDIDNKKDVDDIDKEEKEK